MNGLAGSGVLVSVKQGVKLLMTSDVVQLAVPLPTMGWLGLMGNFTCSWAWSVEFPSTEPWPTRSAVTLKPSGLAVGVKTKLPPALPKRAAALAGSVSAARPRLQAASAA